MRLYRILGAGWAGTQADAKAASKDAGAPWHQYEVPTDKPGLVGFLNERNVPAAVDEVRAVAKLHEPLEPDPMDVAPAPLPPPAATAEHQRNFTAGAIVEFILDQASVAQVENIMATIGTRFAELVKEQRL